MKTFIFIFLVTVISYANAESTEISRLLPFEPIHNSTFCQQEGYACKSCKKSVYCVRFGGSFIEIPIAACSPVSNCLDGACTLDENPDCPIDPSGSNAFMCRTPGMYPDPFDCQTYHHCVKSPRATTLELFTERCRCSYGYSPSTTFCDVRLRDSACPEDSQIAHCGFKGQTGSLRRNPSLYYICQYHPQANSSLYPFIYACENGKLYDSYLYLCV
ncbi:uncharacterized protein LOC116179540 [Photinus pyralis]|uniref:uncharacterized protein LOC116179540 n=1 Tax=Photinus pyralis TaxID=7054 RepID=UPI00126739ED|nr:uncharacterized protein LOC116179540 [Photinus pyralis]